jgi:small subunit ribosomal protein S1
LFMHNDPQGHNDDADASFGDILKDFETSERRTRSGGPRRGTVVGVSGDYVLIDYGAKAEGVIPASDLRDPDGNLSVKRGDIFDVAVTGRNNEGMTTLSRVKGPRPKDWDALKAAFESKQIVAGRVTGTVKGGFTVDLGTRAFLPASRSGTRSPEEMQQLVGQEIRCRIIKFDADDEDVVVDRRSVMEEEAKQLRQSSINAMEEGSVVHGTVRSLTNYGAFVDLGGFDGLLHVGDISWARVTDPASELSVGQELDLKILKVDKDSGKVSLGLKQMSPDPWDEAAARLSPGERVTGTVTRLADFGAFVEIAPGVEGLIHVSEMSWTKRINKASDVLKQGERVEAVVLKFDQAASRLSLGLRQVLGNPWDKINEHYPAGKIVEGKVVRLAKFGAFVEVEEGIEALIHISDFTNEKRIEHPSEFLKVGQTVRAIVLSAEPEARRLKLGMKQLEATATDQFAQQAAVGDRVTGRILQVRGKEVRVQLGEGVEGVCIVEETGGGVSGSASAGSLAEQLAAAWKGGPKSSGPGSGSEPYREGQIRSFTIKSIDPSGRKIELAPAG